MKEMLKKWLGSRKFVLTVACVVVYIVNPVMDLKSVMALFGLPAVYVVMEGLKDTFKKEVIK